MMMKKEPVRVLQLNIGQVFGGVSSMLLNIYREIDHQVIQFDFLGTAKVVFCHVSSRNRVEWRKNH
jgi:hypothetical protein